MKLPGEANILEKVLMAESTKKTVKSGKSAGRLTAATVSTAAREKRTESRPAAEAEAPEDVSDAQRQNLEAFVEANEAIMKGIATLNAEMIAFGNKRVLENVERSESLWHCEDPEQAFRLQFNFFQSAMQQYLDQANNMMAIMSRMAEDFWAPLGARTTESLRSLDEESR